MHVVVLEPHADDAALSIGGRIAARAREPGTRVTIVTVAPRSTFTRDWFDGVQRLDADAVTRLRTAESRRAAEILGAAHATLDEDEATVRFAPSEAWRADFPRVSAAFSEFFGSLPFAEDVRAWAERIDARLTALAPDALWIPLGVGEHVDHRLVRDAALTALTARAARGERAIDVLLYEDLPYAHHHPQHAARVLVALEAAGSRTTPSVEDIGETYAIKSRAVAAFTSQADPGVFERVLRAEALAALPGGLGERAHHLMALGGAPDPAAASLDAPTLIALDARVRALLAERDDVTRLVVLARTAFARPGDELRALRAAFPRAHVQVVVAAAHAWQLAGAGLAPITIAAGDEASWLAHASDAPGTRVLLAAPAGDPLISRLPRALPTPALVQVAALLTHAAPRRDAASATPPT